MIRYNNVDRAFLSGYSNLWVIKWFLENHFRIIFGRWY